MLSTLSGYAQVFVPPIGNKDGTVRVLGGIRVDSAMQLPYWNMSKVYRNKGVDTTGVLAVSVTDSLPRYLKKGVWYSLAIDTGANNFVRYPDTINHQKIYSSFQIDTAIRRINGRLLLFDSILATTDTIYTLPPGVQLESIVFRPTGNQTVQVGTSPSGSDILSPLSVSSGIRTTCNIGKEISGSPQTLYISGITGPVNIHIRSLQ